jgi:hypothetical protein
MTISKAIREQVSRTFNDRCANFKGEQTTSIDPLTEEVVRLFNPRQQVWREHFRWSEDHTQIMGLSACGRATVIALKFNIDEAVNFRKLLITAGWHPPKD